MLFSTHPDIRDYIPKLKGMIEDAFSHIEEYAASWHFDHDDTFLMLNYAAMAHIITTDGDHLLECGSRLCRLNLGEPRWKELAMSILSYVT